MRFFSSAGFSVLSLSLVGTLASSLAGCGRTDLEEDLLGVDGGVDSSLDGNCSSGSCRDTSPPIDARVDVIFPFDTNQPDTGFDARFDSNDASTCNNNGVCDDGETCSTCPTDCGFCAACGDGTCNPGETCSNCPLDCGQCATCGDGFCDDGETCVTCPQDCNVCPTCGDGTCDPNTENCQNCPSDCGTCMGCGDGHCSQDETCISCPADCGSCAVCGNGMCNDGKTCDSCPEDCGTCPIAQTCSDILTCAFGCFSGGLGGFELSCLTDCDANACTQAQGFANAATNCILNAFLSGQCGFGGGGTGSLLQCAETACSSQIAACLGSAPCPTTGGSGSGG